MLKINENFNENIIISKNYKDCYLVYTTKEYYLFYLKNNSYEPIKIDIAEKPSVVEQSLINSTDVSNISNMTGINSSLRFMALHLELGGFEDEKERLYIINELFYDLSNIEDAEINPEDAEQFNIVDRITRLKELTNETIIKEINKISDEINQLQQNTITDELYKSFKFRSGIEKAKRDLGDFLNSECGIVLRINSHDIYKLDKINKGYNSISIDEIINELTDLFGENNLFKTTDVEYAVDFISERLTPQYNIVKFNNGLYDMKQHKLINPDKPVFTLIESPFDYNPNAKPEYIKEYLDSTFERKTTEETETEIKGVKQVIGYLFTSGNIYNALIFLIGIGGAGKGTLATIIAEIFKGKTTQLDFTKIEKDTHATSILIGNHLNIVRETKNGTVEDNTIYKLLSGNDPIDVNPKNQHPYELPAEEVPKTLMNANNLPKFKNPEISILQRFVLIEFKKIFRNTSDDVRDLANLIIQNKQDMEWLIFESLEAYREMVESGEDFILRLSEKETLELIYKHSKPLEYLIRKLILKHDPDAYDYDESNSEFTTNYVVADELNKLVVYLAETEGIQIPLDEKTHKASSRKLLNAIKTEFDLHDYYLTSANDTKFKYTTINKRLEDKTQARVYPELYKTDLYDEILESDEFKEYWRKKESN